MDVAHGKTDKLLEDLEKKIAQEYRTATLDMQRKLNEYLSNFAAQDVKQRQLLKQGKITRQEYRDWEMRHVAMGKRWQDMRDTLSADYHNANEIAKKLAYGTQKDVYALNYNFATYQVEHDAKIDTNFTLYDRDTVERILKDDPKLFHDPGKKKQREIAANKDLRWNKNQVNSAILQGILQGEAIPSLAKRLESVTEKNYHAAVRNARTAVTGAQNAGRIDGYKRAEKMGVDLMKEWMATLDKRTRHEHRQLHGKRVAVDEPFTVGRDKIMYPGDPNAPGYLIYNCRCTVIGQIKGYETDRIEKSPKMDGMSFDEWQNAKNKSSKKVSPLVTFGTALANSLGSDTSAYQTVIQKAGNIVSKIYGLSNALKGCVKTAGGGKYSRYNKTITWDYSNYGDKWSTLAHEYGHFVDDVSNGSLYNSTEVDLLNAKCSLVSGTYKFFKRYASTSDEFLSAMRKDRDSNKGFIADIAINSTMRNDLLKSHASAGVQDAFDGFWGTQDNKDKNKRLPWGHGNRYYDRKYNKEIKTFNLEKDLKDAYTQLGFDASSQAKVKRITRDYETASELWANITSAKTVGGEELQYMEKYFPNAVKAWEKILGGME